MFLRKVRETVYLTSDEDELTSDEEPLDRRLAKNRRVETAFDEESVPCDPPEVPAPSPSEAAEDAPSVRIRFTLKIDGIVVEMPVKPYPCQEAVVTAIINGCREQQHCLVESPTGSGKTLALLCGSLAWQSNYASKIFEADEGKAKQKSDKKIDIEGDRFDIEEGPAKCQAVDDFDLEGLDWSDDSFSETSQLKSVPKIYYGSRTHKQIDQVVRELRKTCYVDKNMTVLSSREVTCIQDTDRDKTQLCNELLDPAKKCGCPYYTEDNKYKIGTNSGLRAYGVENPWDIEDLVQAGREARACPYFAARALMPEADIVFCPYNYIIDPVIRESMQINLCGSIIILDEAHNIENICRDCGSVSLPTDELETIIKDCENVIQMATVKRDFNVVSHVSVVEKFTESLHKFVTKTHLKQQMNSDSLNSDAWTGLDFVNVLDIDKSITSADVTNFMRSAREAASMYALAKELLRTGRPTQPTLSHEVIRTIEKILFAFKMVTSTLHASDYRVIVRQIPQGYKKERSLEFMCMNPGVIFAPICEMARTVILASGTLAPTSSFQGELGVKFPFTIQANHVTPREQVLIKCVPKGPAGTALRATYQNVNTWGFQDDLGAVLLTICEAVPHGILMFFSSYSVMGNLLNRWKTNGTWKKLTRFKSIFQETRGGANVSTMMEDYRAAVRDTSVRPVGAITGALLFAVFRGKVAEGIDFSDNEARCVLTVGIPYAVRNDPVTDMKYQYNDLNRKKGLLSGNEWYAIQAFRALNQALGRVIRHQNDWGAIILIDERFLESRNVNMLPSWVRTMVRIQFLNLGPSVSEYSNVLNFQWVQQTGMEADLRQLLKCFVAKQIKRERGKSRMLASKSERE